MPSNYAPGGGYQQYCSTNTATSFNIPTNIIYSPGPPEPPKPETAIAWLDRRVAEIRVAL
jgi:hypothetical protein